MESTLRHTYARARQCIDWEKERERVWAREWDGDETHTIRNEWRRVNCKNKQARRETCYNTQTDPQIIAGRSCAVWCLIWNELNWTTTTTKQNRKNEISFHSMDSQKTKMEKPVFHRLPSTQSHVRIIFHVTSMITQPLPLTVGYLSTHISITWLKNETKKHDRSTEKPMADGIYALRTTWKHEK